MSFRATFSSLKSHYDANRFSDLLKAPDGIYWLKLRSISRKEQLQAVCDLIGLQYSGIPSRSLLEHVFIHRPDEAIIDDYIQKSYVDERSGRKANEDYLISQLYQMKVFDWGGLFQNSLEQTIVNNYIKKLQGWDDLNEAIDNELHNSLRGYVRCSWYNHWSSILIEDIFKDHPDVLPTVGLVKKIDFFVQDFPFDLKVTYFPDGFMKDLRRKSGLRPEFTELKRFCRSQSIWFDKTKKENTLFPELLTKIEEHPSQSARDFLAEFMGKRREFIRNTLENPDGLKVWLYENQGVRRFDAANRFFLILVDLDNLECSWKLKRNRELLAPAIHRHLDNLGRARLEDLRLSFNWNDTEYETFADILPIVVSQSDYRPQ